jgi:hypothetical protein
MTNCPPRRATFARHLFALPSLALLGGCIDSAMPVLTDAQPLLGERPHLRFFSLHDGAAYEPTAATFRYRNGRYVPTRATADNIGEFSLHGFEGSDLIVQNTRSGRPTEYAIARKVADGAYLVIAIDEDDADEATREAFCGKSTGASCRIQTPEAVRAFARATAAKPHARGGLAVLMAEH